MRIVIAAAAVATLAGCASHGYTCPIPDACAPIHDNYEKSVADTGWDGWQAGGGAPGGKKDEPLGAPGSSGGVPAPPVPAEMRPSGRDATDRPIYTPPAPWVVWLAPWSRDDGTLESGTYVWFTTPGHWSYLGRRWEAPPQPTGADATSAVPSSGARTVRPISPADLGFQPGRPTAQKGVLEDIEQPQAGGQ